MATIGTTLRLFSSKVRHAFIFAWSHMSWWFLALLSAVILPVETSIISWPFRVAYQPIDKNTWGFMFINLGKALTVNPHEKLPALVALGLFALCALILYLLSSMAFVTLIKKLHGHERKFLVFDKASMGALAVHIIVSVKAVIGFGILSFASSYIPHPLTSLAVFVLGAWFLYILFIMGAHAMLSVALHSTSATRALWEGFRYYREHGRHAVSFITLLLITSIAFAVSLTFVAALVLLPLVVIGIVFYSLAYAYAFWGVVITSALLLTILVVASTSLFILVRVKLWNDYLLQPKIQ